MSNSGAIRAGRAYVEAFLDSSKLEKSLGKVSDRLRSFGRQVGAIGGVVAGMGGAIIAPLTASIKVFADAGAQLNKMSTQTGESVENLSRMQFAAGRTGVEMEDLIGSMEELNIRLGETIRDGTGPAAEAFQQLGLDAQALASMTPVERLKAIGDELSKIGSESKRGFLADEIFGGDAFKILPLLRQGSAGIDEMMLKAEELGLVMSQEDAAAAAEFSRMLNELKSSAMAVTRMIGSALIPTATEYAEWLQEAIPEIQAWLAENKEMIVTAAKLGAALLAVGTGLIGVSGAITAVSAAAGTAQAATKLLSGNLLTVAKTAGAAFAVYAIYEMAKAIYNANDAVLDLNRSLRETSQLNGDLLERRRGENNKVLEEANSLNGTEKGDFLAEQLEIAEKKLNGMASSLRGQKRLVEELEPSWLSLWQAGKKVYEVEEKELNNLNDQLRQQKRFVQELQAAKRAQQAEMEQFGERTQEEVAGINSVLDRLNEQLETFGMDAGEQAIRELQKLNASEEELAEARQKMADLAEKEAAAEAQKAAEEEQKRAEEEARKASESIANMLQGLADEVNDLKLPEADREMEKRLRELRRLGASQEQLEAAQKLLAEKAGLTGAGADGKTTDNSPSSQGGTFSSLAGRMFGGDGQDITTGDKKIIDAVNRSSEVITRAMDEYGGLA